MDFENEKKRVIGDLKDSPFGRQMEELNLKNYELQLHQELMRSPMSEWPESLFEFVRERCKEVGMCMEVIVHAVADWIRHPRV